MPNHEMKPGSRFDNPSIVLMVLGTISFVLVVALAYFISDRFESLEDRLGHRAPSDLQYAEHGVYGIEIVEGQTVYVPVYSHIYADGGKPHLLETTLSIRNLDPERAISVKSVQYFDTQGALVKQHVGSDISLPPLAAVEFLVEKRNIRGGSGANFIVQWDADEPVYEPLIEAVMVGFAGNNSISFTSPGRALVERRE